LVPSGKLDPQQGFFEIGMDSLTSMELKNRLQKSLHMNLPNTLTFDYPTTDAVIEYVLNRLPVESSDHTLRSEPIAADPASELADLSREELGNMIDAMLRDVEKREMES
jgi:acyl carrier protein